MVWGLRIRWCCPGAPDTRNSDAMQLEIVLIQAESHVGETNKPNS